MANETANRSHAGLVFQAFINSPPEIARGSWGVVVDDVVRLAGQDGVYSVRLSRPLSSVINATATGLAAIDGIVLASPVGAQPEIRVTLSPDPSGPPPVATPGAPLELTHLLISIFSASIPANFAGVVNIEVRRSPED